jgi:SulP family sulfate permease
LFFGAVDHVKRALYDFSETKKHILVVATGINFIDASGAEMLVSEAQRMKSLGGGLYFSQMKPNVKEFLDRGYTEKIGKENFFAHKHEAIPGIYSRLNRSVCQACTERVFKECSA